MTVRSTRVEAAVLIPGRGDPVPDGCVVVEGGTITYAGPQAGSPAAPEAEGTGSRS